MNMLDDQAPHVLQMPAGRASVESMLLSEAQGCI